MEMRSVPVLRYAIPQVMPGHQKSCTHHYACVCYGGRHCDWRTRLDGHVHRPVGSWRISPHHLEVGIFPGCISNSLRKPIELKAWLASLRANERHTARVHSIRMRSAHIAKLVHKRLAEFGPVVVSVCPTFEQVHVTIWGQLLRACHHRICNDDRNKQRASSKKSQSKIERQRDHID